MRGPLEPVSIEPIGVIRTPFTDKASAPRQSTEAKDVKGTVELFEGRGYEDALDGIETFDTLWLIFHFHQALGRFHPKVQPPRSETKLGVFATRSPHRPSGIGMSAVRLERVEGLRLFVAGVDMIDGTPLFDIKPYIPYADAIDGASSGWLDVTKDPGPRYVVTWDELARRQCEYLREQHGVDLASTVTTLLSTGPEPHAYRRIRRAADGTSTLAVKAWRFRFTTKDRTITVESISSGYRPSELAIARPGEAEELASHRAFEEAFRAGA
ncbi:MAG: tRNA (N6-threonylcarbamoyladenosine(37)-N6)-methyltransferase TrmO [Polyangiaceae bacterium]|nr:tRNA (N6-threonylcarbamoyladenosine(37)-N6)-methyltransferase TrmO [Polyangiaceae bacterium]